MSPLLDRRRSARVIIRARLEASRAGADAARAIRKNEEIAEKVGDVDNSAKENEARLGTFEQRLALAEATILALDGRLKALEARGG